MVVLKGAVIAQVGICKLLYLIIILIINIYLAHFFTEPMFESVASSATITPIFLKAFQRESRELQIHSPLDY